MEQFDLLDDEELPPYDGSAVLHPSVLTPSCAHEVMDDLLREVPWEQHEITIFGRTTPQLRLVAWYDDSGFYNCTGLTLQPHEWTPLLREVRDLVQSLADTSVDLAVIGDGNRSRIRADPTLGGDGSVHPCERGQ